MEPERLSIHSRLRKCATGLLVETTVQVMKGCFLQVLVIALPDHQLAALAKLLGTELNQTRDTWFQGTSAFIHTASAVLTAGETHFVDMRPDVAT